MEKKKNCLALLLRDHLSDQDEVAYILACDVLDAIEAMQHAPRSVSTGSSQPDQTSIDNFQGKSEAA